VFSFSKEKKMPGKTIQGLPRSSPGQRLQKRLDTQSTGAGSGNSLSAPGRKLQKSLVPQRPVQMGTPQRPPSIKKAPVAGVAPGGRIPTAAPRQIPSTPKAPGIRGAKKPTVRTGIKGAKNPTVRTGIKKGVSVKTGIKGTKIPTLKSSPPPGGIKRVGGNGTKPKTRKPRRKPLYMQMTAASTTRSTPSPTRKPRRRRTRPRGER